MMTRISPVDEADAWCRQLGNFAPIVYRPALATATSTHAVASLFEYSDLGAPAPMHSRRQRGAVAVQFLFATLMMAAAIWPLSASAQAGGGGMGGGMGGRGGHGDRGGRSPQTMQKDPGAAATPAPNPQRAMLGEMRKLRVDLLLTADQVGPWSTMENALRECIELSRPHPPGLNTGAAIDPQQYLQDMADSQRELADAEARLAVATKAAFAVLNPRQLRTSKDRLGSAIAGEQTATASLP